MKKVYNSPIMKINNYLGTVSMLAGSNTTEAGWGNGKPVEQGGISTGQTPGGTLSKYRTNFYEEYN